MNVGQIQNLKEQIKAHLEAAEKPSHDFVDVLNGFSAKEDVASEDCAILLNILNTSNAPELQQIKASLLEMLNPPAVKTKKEFGKGALALVPVTDYLTNSFNGYQARARKELNTQHPHHYIGDEIQTEKDLVSCVNYLIQESNPPVEIPANEIDPRALPPSLANWGHWKDYGIKLMENPTGDITPASWEAISALYKVKRSHEYVNIQRNKSDRKLFDEKQTASGRDYISYDENPDSFMAQSRYIDKMQEFAENKLREKNQPDKIQTLTEISDRSRELVIFQDKLAAVNAATDDQTFASNLQAISGSIVEANMNENPNQFWTTAKNTLDNNTNPFLAGYLIPVKSLDNLAKNTGQFFQSLFKIPTEGIDINKIPATPINTTTQALLKNLFPKAGGKNLKDFANSYAQNYQLAELSKDNGKLSLNAKQTAVINCIGKYARNEIQGDLNQEIQLAVAMAAPNTTYFNENQCRNVRVLLGLPPAETTDNIKKILTEATARDPQTTFKHEQELTRHMLAFLSSEQTDNDQITFVNNATTALSNNYSSEAQDFIYGVKTTYNNDQFQSIRTERKSLTGLNFLGSLLDGLSNRAKQFGNFISEPFISIANIFRSGAQATQNMTRYGQADVPRPSVKTTGAIISSVSSSTNKLNIKYPTQQDESSSLKKYNKSKGFLNAQMAALTNPLLSIPQKAILYTSALKELREIQQLINDKKLSGSNMNAAKGYVEETYKALKITPLSEKEQSELPDADAKRAEYFLNRIERQAVDAEKLVNQQVQKPVKQQQPATTTKQQQNNNINVTYNGTPLKNDINLNNQEEDTDQTQNLSHNILSPEMQNATNAVQQFIATVNQEEKSEQRNNRNVTYNGTPLKDDINLNNQEEDTDQDQNLSHNILSPEMQEATKAVQQFITGTVNQNEKPKQQQPSGLRSAEDNTKSPVLSSNKFTRASGKVPVDPSRSLVFNTPTDFNNGQKVSSASQQKPENNPTNAPPSNPTKPTLS